ncbi:unnamed protein product, partial [Amoebophrya sp. A25]
GRPTAAAYFPPANLRGGARPLRGDDELPEDHVHVEPAKSGKAVADADEEGAPLVLDWPKDSQCNYRSSSLPYDHLPGELTINNWPQGLVDVENAGKYYNYVLQRGNQEEDPRNTWWKNSLKRLAWMWEGDSGGKTLGFSPSPRRGEGATAAVDLSTIDCKFEVSFGFGGTEFHLSYPNVAVGRGILLAKLKADIAKALCGRRG